MRVRHAETCLDMLRHAYQYYIHIYILPASEFTGSVPDQQYGGGVYLAKVRVL
jgi:hypothetical protein